MRTPPEALVEMTDEEIAAMLGPDAAEEAARRMGRRLASCEAHHFRAELARRHGGGRHPDHRRAAAWLEIGVGFARAFRAACDRLDDLGRGGRALEIVLEAGLRVRADREAELAARGLDPAAGVDIPLCAEAMLGREDPERN